eukprot:3293097-Heterocapsa_arctica.AAC.1
MHCVMCGQLLICAGYARWAAVSYVRKAAGTESYVRRCVRSDVAELCNVRPTVDMCAHVWMNCVMCAQPSAHNVHITGL